MLFHYVFSGIPKANSLITRFYFTFSQQFMRESSFLSKNLADLINFNSFPLDGSFKLRLNLFFLLNFMIFYFTSKADSINFGMILIWNYTYFQTIMVISLY